MGSNIHDIVRFLIPDQQNSKRKIYRGEQQIIFDSLANILSEYTPFGKKEMQAFLLGAIREWERIRRVTFASMRLESSQNKIFVVEEVFHLLRKELVSCIKDPDELTKLNAGFKLVMDQYRNDFADRDFFN